MFTAAIKMHGIERALSLFALAYEHICLDRRRESEYKSIMSLKLTAPKGRKEGK